MLLNVTYQDACVVSALTNNPVNNSITRLPTWRNWPVDDDLVTLVLTATDMRIFEVLLAIAIPMLVNQGLRQELYVTTGVGIDRLAPSRAATLHEQLADHVRRGLAPSTKVQISYEDLVLMLALSSEQIIVQSRTHLCFVSIAGTIPSELVREAHLGLRLYWWRRFLVPAQPSTTIELQPMDCVQLLLELANAAEALLRDDREMLDRLASWGAVDITAGSLLVLAMRLSEMQDE